MRSEFLFSSAQSARDSFTRIATSVAAADEALAADAAVSQPLTSLVRFHAVEYLQTSRLVSIGFIKRYFACIKIIIRMMINTPQNVQNLYEKKSNERK